MIRSYGYWMILVIAVLLISGSSRASFDIDSPSAYVSYAQDGPTPYVSANAKVLDGNYKLFYSWSYPYWVACGNFTNWLVGQTPVPNTATILHVYLVAVVQYPVSSSIWFNLQYLLGESSANMSAGTASWIYTPNGNAIWVDGPFGYWRTYRLEVTNETFGGPTGGWTPEMLKSNETWVRIYSNSPKTEGNALWVDYVGLEYEWEYPGGGGGGGGESISLPIDVIDLMGMTGFIGMIGIPAASIWFFRHDGGSKIHAGVMALIGFTVCFGFFLASINGG